MTKARELTIRQQLFAWQDIKYRDFAKRLLPQTEKLIGVRLPLIDKYARQLVSSRGKECCCIIPADYFEETMLEAMLISYLPLSLEEKLHCLGRFVPKITNWSICDSLCIRLKFAEQNRSAVWEFLHPFFESTHEYELRFAFVMALNYFLLPEYLDKVFERVAQFKSHKFYAQTAVAWLLSLAFIKFSKETWLFLENCSLDDETFAKTLQKIRESRQISPKVKKEIRKLKR